MKTFTFLALATFLFVLSSCKQNSPAPSNPSPTAPTTPSTTPTPTTPTSGMTATEAALVGDWIWDKTEVYSSGNLSQIYTPTTQQILPAAPTTYTYYAGSHMVLKSSFYNGTATTSTLVPQYYNADYYSYQSQSMFWYVKPNAIGNQLMSLNSLIPFAFSIGNIITLNASTLVVQVWTQGGIPNGNKCYYHK